MRAALAAFLLAGALLMTVPAGAQAPRATTTTLIDLYGNPVPKQEIIPRPNSGHKPVDAGDRGGALQLGLLALLVVVVGGAVTHVVRESRRARAEQT